MATLLAAHLDTLACPVCRGGLKLTPATVDCVMCGLRYPIVDGLPVLIGARAVSSVEVPTPPEESASN
jgi:uncharacterized protein YbaR (Trm112 family)